MRYIQSVPLAVVMASVVLMGWSCNPFKAAQEKAEQQAADSIVGGILSKATGGKVDVDTDSNQVEYRDNKTGSTVAFGDDLKLPKDFPSDVPIYGGAKISALSTNKQEGMANVTLTSEDGKDKVLGWYENEMKSAGWEEENSSTINQVDFREYTKGKAKIAVSVWPNEDDEKGGTFVTLSRTEEMESPADENQE
jgi:hypothetical protein